MVFQGRRLLPRHRHLPGLERRRVGDIRGLIGRLDYLARLGITCLWLHPIHPSPNRDDGYDATDFYNVDPRFGTLGDFAELLHEARNRASA